MVTVNVDGSVLDRIAKIMSYLRLGSSGKVLKKKKKDREVKGMTYLVSCHLNPLGVLSCAFPKVYCYGYKIKMPPSIFQKFSC